MIRSLTLEAPAWNKREIMRYARIRDTENDYHTLIDECIDEAKDVLSYRVCYTVLPADHDGVITIGTAAVASKTLKKAIRGAKEALLFAATVGAPFDRLIQRYSSAEPSRALVFQAIGAERAESLCDAFCEQMTSQLRAAGKCLTPRVSPGYGDITLDIQKDIFAVLDCPRKIGLTLDESLLMSPSKSVTAIAGIVRECEAESDKCSSCDKNDCVYRQ